jgi:FKBP-type peptidyl-prolyl cis-trans isomerase (trigger factor)
MAGPPKKPTPPPVRGRPQTVTAGRSLGKAGTRQDGRTVSIEAGRALQRALDEAPQARVAVKAAGVSSATAERAVAAAGSITLTIAALPIDAALVARRIEELRKLISMTMPRVRAPIEASDEVEADILGYVDGKVFLAQQAAWLEVRSNPWLPGLMEGFIGLTPPDSAVFQLRLPEHYPVPDLAGKVAVFAVTLRRARQRIMPEADDPLFLLLTNRNVKTKAELEAKLREELAEERARLCVDEAKVGLLRKLYIAIGVDDDVPEDLVEEELRRRWKVAMGEAMALQGLSLEDQKRSLVDFSTAAMRAEARRTVWEGRCLEAVADAHHIESTDAEVHTMMADLATDLRRPDVDAILFDHAALTKDIVRSLRLHRALLVLLGKAKVTFDSTPPSASRQVLEPLPTAGSGAARGGSGSTQPSSDTTASRGLKRPTLRQP